MKERLIEKKGMKNTTVNESAISGCIVAIKITSDNGSICQKNEGGNVASGSMK